MRITRCTGKYAEQPYEIKACGSRVYCIEELCYGIKENAFLLDAGIMKDDLVDWLREECGLAELADSLYRMIHRKGSLSTFISTILDYADFYDPETIRQVSAVLRQGAGLKLEEKKKLRADYLLRKGRYEEALTEYSRMIFKIEKQISERDGVQENGLQENEDASAKLLARLYHNKGTALAAMMYYDEAKEAYEQAYLLGQEEESLVCCLAAEKLSSRKAHTQAEKRENRNFPGNITFGLSEQETGREAEKEARIAAEKEADMRLTKVTTETVRQQLEKKYGSDHKQTRGILSRELTDNYRVGAL